MREKLAQNTPCPSIKLPGLRKVMPAEKNLRIVTYNVGGGRDEFHTTATDILTVIKNLQPDILGLQECTAWLDANHKSFSFSQQIDHVLGFEPAGYLGKTISLQENFHPRKKVMLDCLYKDWQDWIFGNAICTRYAFTRLGDPETPGMPKNVTIFKPLVYEGNRDTDPRGAIISRVRVSDSAPFIVSTHFTTLVGERGGRTAPVPGKFEEAQTIRLQQAKKLLELLKPRLEERQPIILMGDFNADPQEPCIRTVIEGEGGFVRLTPKSEIPTHPKVSKPVDHIFVFPGDAVQDYTCWVDNSTAAQKASDHLPVAADIVFR